MRIDPMTLPRAARWKASFEGKPGLWDYLSQQGGATLAIAFTDLFWPRLVEVRGCVLLAEHFDEQRFEEWWRELEGRCGAIEATVNHLHLWHLFDPEEVTDEGLAELARALACCWRAALVEAYPDRDFEVSVSGGDEDYGPTLTFRSVTS